LTLKTFRASRADEKPIAKSEGGVEADEAGSKVRLDGQVSEEDAWSDVLDTIAKIIPLLRSRVSDTRHAAAFALGLLAGTLPPWTQPWTSPPPASSRLDLPLLVKNGQTLLASAGREYIAKPVGGDKAKRRKAMMGSLGLGDAVGWGEDVDKVIGDEEDDADMEAVQSRAGTPKVEQPKDLFEGLSARQITMLKRKKGNVIEEANK
jgi:TATA-binding protein-associated factor